MMQHLNSVSQITSRGVAEKVIFAALDALEKSTDSEYTEVIQFDVRPGETLDQEELKNIAKEILAHHCVENNPDLDVSIDEDTHGLVVTFCRPDCETMAQ